MNLHAIWTKQHDDFHRHVNLRVRFTCQQEEIYYHLKAKHHWSYWSLLPAAVAVALCWLTREPITALFGGIVTGAFLLGKFDITENVKVHIDTSN